jgi:hypothetical protein
VSGLPRSAINITLDGMSVQDNYLKTTDGYFARLSPLLDSVEEVTVTTAGNTADATGQGAVQIRFVTKAGTNQWTGTAYEYFRHDALNANTWFRNRDLPPIRKPARRRRTSCGNTRPASRRAARSSRTRRSSSSTTRTALAELEHAAARHPDAGGGVRHLQLRHGRLAAAEPAADRGGQRAAGDDRSDRGQVLGQIQAATTQSGGVTPLNNPLVQQYTWSMPTKTSTRRRRCARLRDHPQPSPERLVQLSPHQLDARHDQQRAAALPEFAADRQPAVDALDDVGIAALDVWRQLFNEFRVGGSGGATLVLAGVRDRHVVRHQRLSPQLQRRVLRHRRAADQLEPRCRPVLARGLDQGRREHHDVAEGQPQHAVRRGDGAGRRVAGEPDARADRGVRLLPSEAADAIFNATTLPGASAADITQAKRSTRC